MITAGVDIGNRTTKSVLLGEGRVLSWALMETRGDINRLAELVIREAAAKAGLKSDNITQVGATGAGGSEVKFIDECFTSILCAAVGSNQLFPLVEIGIDIGAEECRVFRSNGKGDIIDFIINDKCAAGVGMFIEVMAKTLGVTLEEAGILSLKSSKQLPLSTSCVVFAESEVISLINEGERKEDVLRAIHIVAAMKAAALLRMVGVTKEFVAIGGVALNIGFIDCLKSMFKVDLRIPENPQIVGALGAALLAEWKR